VKTLFIFDCVASLPGLITGESSSVNFTKLFRLVHWSRFFQQLDTIASKLLLNSFNFNKQKASEVVDLIRLFLFVFLITHIIACLWITVGRANDDGWVIKSDRNSDDYAGELLIESYYFIVTTITTVGYGDVKGGNSNEYVFSMFIEFGGLAFYSMLMGTITMMFSGDQSFEALINERMRELDLWLRKLELSNQGMRLKLEMYTDIKKNIMVEFVNDFNLIIEEFDFYVTLPPHL